jgi:membrane protease subunit HflC
MRLISLGTLVTAILVVVVLLVKLTTFMVRFSEVAVKVRMGQVAAIVDKPGLYPRWPYPFESIKTYDTRLRTLDTLESEIKTRDGKNVIVGNYALWRIANPNTFYIRVGNERDAEDKLRVRINQRRAAVIGNENLSAFVNLNQAAVDANYDRIENELLNGIQTEGESAGLSLRDAVLADFGIDVVKVDLRRISLPEETTQTVFQQMSAERQKEAARFREEGKSRAETIRAQAEADRDQIIAFAERKAQEIQSTGIQAATGILKQINAEDAEFFEWLCWLDALRDSLRQKSTIFLDSRSTMFDYFKAPVAPHPESGTASGRDAPLLKLPVPGPDFDPLASRTAEQPESSEGAARGNP